MFLEKAVKDWSEAQASPPSYHKQEANYQLCQIPNADIHSKEVLSVEHTIKL
jgi:hypothetical protein